jgi:RHS repeat-associated protein
LVSNQRGYAETDLAGTTKSEYIFFDGTTGTGGVFYYFSDHLKTASVITDSAGVIKAESDYYHWGGELQFVNNDSNDYKFTGKKRDLETGLDYFGARYYSNGLGRWVSADWSSTPVPVPYADFSDPQTLNLYSYVRNLPTTKTDLDGHGPWNRLKCAFGSADACAAQAKEDQEARKKKTEDERNWLVDHLRNKDGSKLNDEARKKLNNLSEKELDTLYDQLHWKYQQAQDLGQLGLPPAPLRLIHSNETLDAGQSYKYWQGKSNEEIIESLKPGKAEALRVKQDGSVMNGNNRIRVLQERGVDVNSLPREEIIE